ncbi:GEVED domain-containing protein, partial [Flavobacterium terrigena]
FYVTAYDAAGNTSAASNTVNVTTLSAAVVYCISNGNTANEFINRVQIGTINNLSGNNSGYGNFTSMSTSVNLGSLVSISISAGWVNSSYAEAFNVWIDYNKNGSFESNELVYSKSKSKAATVSGSFTIPTSALTGTTRMRVSMKYNANPSACEVFTRGEVEDYSINIVNGGIVKTSDVSTESETEEVDVEVKETATLNTNKNEVEELSYKLYPNPVKDGVMYFSGLTNNSSYKIFNQMGQELAQGTIENDMINVSSLTTGIYFVQVTNNSAVGVKRFIKE